MIPTSSGSEALRKDLAALVSLERASTEEADRIAYARDLWPRQQIATRMGNIAIAPPAVIVWPSNVDEVSAVVKYAASNGVPYGAGSGVCGVCCRHHKPSSST